MKIRIKIYLNLLLYIIILIKEYISLLHSLFGIALLLFFFCFYGFISSPSFKLSFWLSNILSSSVPEKIVIVDMGICCSQMCTVKVICTMSYPAEFAYEYIFLCWYDSPERGFSISIYLRDGCCLHWNF